MRVSYEELSTFNLGTRPRLQRNAEPLKEYEAETLYAAASKGLTSRAAFFDGCVCLKERHQKYGTESSDIVVVYSVQ